MRAVAFFCSCGGRGGERAFAQMARACGTKPAATLIVGETSLGQATVPVERFVAELRAALPDVFPQVPTRPTPVPPSRPSAMKP